MAAGQFGGVGDNVSMFFIANEISPMRSTYNFFLLYLVFLMQSAIVAGIFLLSMPPASTDPSAHKFHLSFFVAL